MFTYKFLLFQNAPAVRSWSASEPLRNDPGGSAARPAGTRTVSGLFSDPAVASRLQQKQKLLPRRTQLKRARKTRRRDGTTVHAQTPHAAKKEAALRSGLQELRSQLQALQMDVAKQERDSDMEGETT